MAIGLSGVNSLEEIEEFEQEYTNAGIQLGEAEGQVAEIEQTVRQFLSGDGQPAGVVGSGEVVEEVGPEPMSEEEFIGMLNNELSWSLGAHDEISGHQSRAMDYYLGRPRGDEMPGRSQIQSLDVADMVEALLSQIVPAFMQNMSVEFVATDPADEKSAKMESAYVTHIINEVNNGFTTFYSLFKDALLMKNCVCDLAVVDNEHIETETVENVNALAISQLMQPTKPNETVEITGSAPGAMPGLWNIEVTRKWTSKSLITNPQPIDEFRVNSDHRNISLDTARFSGYFEIVSESDLIEAGYDPDLVADLPTFGQTTDQVQQSRSQTQNEVTHYGQGSNRPISIFKGLFKVDYDQDGIAERRRIVCCANHNTVSHILENEIQDFNTFASGTPFIQTDRWLGLSIFDKLKEIQDQKTAFLRNTMDNAYFANNRRLGYVVGQANSDDVHNSKPGSSIRLKRADALVPVEHTNILPYSLQLLEYLDKIRSERAGAALDMQTEALPVGAETAHGAERLVSAKEQLAALIASTLARTVVRDIYLIAHRLIREFMGGEQSFKTGDMWNTVNPSQWPVRGQVGIKVGMSQGERIQQAGAIQNTIQRQTELMQGGFSGTLVNAQGIYKAQVDFGRLMGLPSPESYWVDPDSPQAIQAGMQQQQQMMQQQQQMERQQQQMFELQLRLQQMQEETKRMGDLLKAQTKAAELQEDREQHMDDTAVDLTKLELDSGQNVPGSVV